MKNKAYDIYKAAGIIIVERKLLVVRQKERDFFIFPGGKVEKGENPEDALIRELREEVGIRVKRENLKFFETYYAESSKCFPKSLQVDAYNILSWNGDLKPSNGEECIEEMLWLSSYIPKGINVSSILEFKAIQRLKKLDLID